MEALGRYQIEHRQEFYEPLEKIININKDTCWYGGKDFYDKMIESVKNHLPFSDIGHGKVLIELINMVDNENLKFIDVGVGGGLSNTIVKKSEFCGCDLPHVIENVSKVTFPNLKYINCDLIEGDLSFINSFDIVLMNAIVDVMEFPLLVLNKVLSNSNNYVIIHRQEISNRYLTNGFTLLKSESYGGFTYRTILERKAFNKILKENNFSIIKELDSGLGIFNNKSFLLKKEC